MQLRQHFRPWYMWWVEGPGHHEKIAGVLEPSQLWNAQAILGALCKSWSSQEKLSELTAAPKEIWLCGLASAFVGTC